MFLHPDKSPPSYVSSSHAVSRLFLSGQPGLKPVTQGWIPSSAPRRGYSILLSLPLSALKCQRMNSALQLWAGVWIYSESLGEEEELEKEEGVEVSFSVANKSLLVSTGLTG